VPSGDAHLQLVPSAGLDGVQVLDDLVEAHQVERSRAGDSGPDARFDALAGEPLRGERQDRLRERAARVAHQLRHDLPASPDGRVRLRFALAARTDEPLPSDLGDDAELVARGVDGELQRRRAVP
jgi:hypothetical protein